MGEFYISRKLRCFCRANYRATREPNITPKEIRMVMPFVAFDEVKFQSLSFGGLGIKSPKVLKSYCRCLCRGEGNGDVYLEYAILSLIKLDTYLIHLTHN